MNDLLKEPTKRPFSPNDTFNFGKTQNQLSKSNADCQFIYHFEAICRNHIVIKMVVLGDVNDQLIVKNNDSFF